MILSLLTFGDNLENHYQANFAILSYLKDPRITDVCIVTDRPQYYRSLQPKITIIELNDEMMQTWRGEADFFWRIKMKAIEAAALRFPDQHLLYVDSDTFLATDLARLEVGLNDGQCFMHEQEGLLSVLSSKTEKKMWQSLQNKTFANHHITEQTAMWNAGVIALPANIAINTIQNAIQACDEMCHTDCTRRLIEQFAFSLASNACNNLQPANQEIAHYWGNKDGWNSLIKDFFMHCELTQNTLEEKIDLIKLVDAKSRPIIKKEKRIKRLLHNIIDKLIPSKQITYYQK